MVALVEKVKDIADHFGFQKQIDKGIEELNELILELCKSRGQEGLAKGTITEMADALIMIAQLMYLGNISPMDLEKEIQSKIDRTNDRIASGYYERWK